MLGCRGRVWVRASSSYKDQGLGVIYLTFLNNFTTFLLIYYNLQNTFRLSRSLQVRRLLKKAVTRKAFLLKLVLFTFCL